MRMLKKITSILKDESGAALVVTVSVFLFIYLAILGVYAIGMNVRNRIHLQNACDAAAYSAAVVQADALSRIATLNRAMSWTYCQMTKRQMDYIIYKWLKGTVEKYGGDLNKSFELALDGCCRHYHVPTRTCSHDIDDKILLKADEKRDAVLKHIDDINSECRDFKSYIDQLPKEADDSFYDAAGKAISRLTSQIDSDKKNINGMNKAIENIKDDISNKVSKAACYIAHANIPTEYSDSVEMEVFQGKPSVYFRYMGPNEEGEFRKFAGSTKFDFKEQTWFKCFPAKDPSDNKVKGFGRQYVTRDEDRMGLVASWSWWAKKRLCSDNGGCPLVYLNKWKVYNSYSKASEYWDLYYKGEPVSPHVLTEDYFGSNGTITVGIAVPNSNPFARIIGSVSGIFSAFNPGVTKTVCFSSAKAGYCKTLGGNNEDRRYSVDWDPRNQSWNLCQSDWDAVFVPVRRAGSKAEKGAWQGDVAPFLGNLASRLGIGKDDFKAGKKVMSSKAKYVKYLEYDKDGVGGGEVGWRVKNQEAAVDWDELHNRMFH
jgi:hypothetical protein